MVPSPSSAKTYMRQNTECTESYAKRAWAARLIDEAEQGEEEEEHLRGSCSAPHLRALCQQTMMQARMVPSNRAGVARSSQPTVREVSLGTVQRAKKGTRSAWGRRRTPLHGTGLACISLWRWAERLGAVWSIKFRSNRLTLEIWETAIKDHGNNVEGPSGLASKVHTGSLQCLEAEWDHRGRAKRATVCEALCGWTRM
jgi:hypothetical protein